MGEEMMKNEEEVKGTGPFGCIGVVFAMVVAIAVAVASISVLSCTLAFGEENALTNGLEQSSSDGIFEYVTTGVWLFAIYTAMFPVHSIALLVLVFLIGRQFKR